MPPDLEGWIHDISYAELTNTGMNVQVQVQPSGTNIDVKALTARQSFSYGEARDAGFGIIPRTNVLQVITSVGNAAVRVVYTIEESRFA